METSVSKLFPKIIWTVSSSSMRDFDKNEILQYWHLIMFHPLKELMGGTVLFFDSICTDEKELLDLRIGLPQEPKDWLKLSPYGWRVMFHAGVMRCFSFFCDLELCVSLNPSKSSFLRNIWTRLQLAPLTIFSIFFLLQLFDLQLLTCISP
uniref:Uncharacterized protein n=1 Tax=Hippocampus comes TaxID=109280 RepID=A0A3Q2XLY0_HIPCM